MSDYARAGMQQFTEARVKTSKASELEKKNQMLDASPYGFRTERYNTNEEQRKFKKAVDKTEDEPEEITMKEQDKIEQNLELERAHLLNNASQIRGLRIYDTQDKVDSKKMYDEHEKITIAGMGRSISNGTGIYGQGGFLRINYINSELNKPAPDNKG